MWIQRTPAAALAACLVGLVLCPFAFLATGALSDFSPVFIFVALPPLFLGCGFLLWRFLQKPRESVTRRFPFRIVEALSFVVVVAFLYLISGAHLMIGWERFGAVSMIFLAISAACFPILLLRPTTIERRLTRLPKRVSIALLVLIIVVSGIAMISYLTRPPTFIG